MKSSILLSAKLLLSKRDAFERFYRDHSCALRTYIRYKIGVAEDGEEILQDTFFSFLEALRDFRGQASLKTFLYSIARNKIIDYYRRRKVKTLFFSQAPHLGEFVSQVLAPDERFEEKELHQRITKTMNKIQPLYKDILMWKYDHGMSVYDIAKKLAVSFKSAEAKLFRARKAFVEVFAVTQ